VHVSNCKMQTERHIIIYGASIYAQVSSPLDIYINLKSISNRNDVLYKQVGLEAATLITWHSMATINQKNDGRIKGLSFFHFARRFKMLFDIIAWVVYTCTGQCKEHTEDICQKGCAHNTTGATMHGRFKLSRIF
jgi:hypothetical protein